MMPIRFWRAKCDAIKLAVGRALADDASPCFIDDVYCHLLNAGDYCCAEYSKSGLTI